MSESIMRKVQPFTIGTKLSAPPVPKCQEFTQRRFLPTVDLDSCGFQHNLSSLYLSPSQVCAHDPRLSSPTVITPAAPAKREHVAGDDLIQNAGSASAVCRSIKKITISERTDRPGRTTGGPARPRLTAPSSEKKNNNNNNNNSSSSEPQLPRILGVSYESKPNSEFKVLLSKEIQAVHGQARERLSGENSVEIPAPERKTDEAEVTERCPPSQDEVPDATAAAAAAALQDGRFAQPNSLFTKEALQAEAWIKGKLQDLKDGCDAQCCPLQDREEAPQTLQRDLKDFENNLIQLNQLGERLICKLNPTSDAVKKQLGQLREQWQTLKQMAANRTGALAAAQSLQEFNQKVDKLEAWIKEKDEQQHRNLHEEINHLALKLEKLGRADSRMISSRRKLINKMWLKVQSHLKTYQEKLHLALEVSSFYQQADKVLLAMNSVRKSMSASKELDSLDDREIRDIGSQIMILDVSVSQLSNLHPSMAAGITRRQGEVKESWALLQRVFRGDRTPLSLSGSTFTREDADLLTPDQEPRRSVGAETHAVMGKEVKEEQNRLKGCVEPCGNVKRAAGGQSQERRSLIHASSPVEEGPVCTNHAATKQQPKGESRKPRAEPKLPAASRSHTQLQRFTVSADKTLSWLRDNVSMATQVCSTASSEGPEAARKCHYALEEEILNNRARMEVVKREGHGLVRAQHPGSARIEEFLTQLEVLWEELKRRHQRNAVFLQASKELGFRVVKVLQALGSLDAWLESVELSMKESALAGDPETMSLAERESRLLEKEVAARSLELSELRQEVDRLHAHSHPHARRMPERMDEVEKKYHRVLAALTQQSSELQDTRMLTEFLERVELEESQEPGGSGFSLAQPLHSDMSSAPSLFELQSSSSVEPLLETMGNPVEELREAVEMLNDTVRKRSRSQSHDQAIQELMSKHASLAVRVEECLRCSEELRLDILEKETDMAMQCEPDHCGLEALQEKQDHLETAHGVISEEVKEVKNQASQLQELCPERVHMLEARIQATLRAWAELGKSVTENKARLQEFSQLQDFFRSYLAMISWTEDTRSCIFSDSALHRGKDGQKLLAADLDSQIQQKFEEFDVLAFTGRTILDTEHHLAQMVRERMEELRSMLGWISVHWRAQKQQWCHRSNRRKPLQDDVYSEATMCSLSSDSELEALWSHQAPRVRTRENGTRADPRAELLQPAEQHETPSEDGYEVMNGIGAEAASLKTNVVVLKESSSQQAVNLILSFGGGGDSQVQVLDLPVQTDADGGEQPLELVHRPTAPQASACKSFWRRCQGLLENTLGSLKRKKKVYRPSANQKRKFFSPQDSVFAVYLSKMSKCDSRISVSTYLHVKDNGLSGAPVYESITLPRQKSCSASPVSPTFPQSSAASGPQPTNAVLHPLTGSSSGSIFSSLKRMSKKRKRKRDTRRHTIQRIMGVDEQTDGMHLYECETLTYDTRTWPLKEGRRTRKDSGGAAAYMKNPLLTDIDSEGSREDSITPYAVSAGPSSGPSAAQTRTHCRVLSLGSVLSFDLPKDMTLIPSIQDIITIAPPESKREGADLCLHSHKPTVLSSFKQSPEVANVSSSDPPGGFQAPPPKDPPDGHQSNPSYAQCDAAEQERNKMPSDTSSDAGDGPESSWPPNLSIYVNHPRSAAAVTHKHRCVSVHTRIRDLNGHFYHKCAPSRWGQEQSGGLQVSQASLMKLNPKSAPGVGVRQDSVDSGISSVSSFKLGADMASADSRPKGVVGKLLSLEVGALDCSQPRENHAASPGPPPKSAEEERERVHPDHQEFEEEEEELEDIWNQTPNCRQSICSDIMYRPNQEVSAGSGQLTEALCCSPPAQKQTALYRDLVTASAPDLFTAELQLPSHIPDLLGFHKAGTPKDHLPPLAKGDRRSWAAFPVGEADSKTSVTTNETAPAPVKLPDVGDRQRYVYHYREEEEEEEEGMKVEEVTGCLKTVGSPPPEQDQPLSAVSALVGSVGASQEERPHGVASTGGRRVILGGKPELQSMEGTLEKKQRLQQGGKKAASRGWNSYFAVLSSHTMCFFQDGKDALRSAACGLPLNLAGAECSPASDYTKKPNCFRLRLPDGAEYLFSVSSHFMMRKWVMRVQASTGQGGSSSSSADPRVPTSIEASWGGFRCQDGASCHCSSLHGAPITSPSRKPTTKEIVVLSRPQSRLRSRDGHPTISSSDGRCYDDGRLTHAVTHRVSEASPSTRCPPSAGQDWLSTQSRSHSFTSSTYQRIQPTAPSPAGKGLEKGSNYSVTLVVGEKAGESPLPASAGWQCDAHLRSFASLPRPSSKSVFKKFFGKKEL
uniref:PH domain-containing protein n=1 Tax=Oryzias latipes TaxID=8090 RepID=A0A3P9IMB5_ORYLA